MKGKYEFWISCIVLFILLETVCGQPGLLWDEHWATNNTIQFGQNATFPMTGPPWNQWGVYGDSAEQFSIQNHELILSDPNSAANNGATSLTLLARTNLGIGATVIGKTIVWTFSVNDTTTTNGGVFGGVTTNDQSYPVFGWLYRPGSAGPLGGNGLSPYCSIGGNYISGYFCGSASFRLNTTMGVAETFFPNSVSFAVQGGEFGQFGCYFGSTNWFTFYVHTNAVPFVGSFEPLFGQFGDPYQTLASIQVYTNWTPGTAAADLDDETDSSPGGHAFGVKLHVPSIGIDPATKNIIAAWQGGTTGGDISTNNSIRLAFRTNGVWSKWQVMNAGNGPTNYGMGGLGVINGRMVCFYNMATNLHTNCAVLWRTVAISDGTLAFGAENVLKVTNSDSIITGTNFLCLTPPIIAPDGAYVLPIVALTNDASDHDWALYCMRSQNGVDWKAFQIGLVGTHGSEPTFYVEGGKLQCQTRTHNIVSDDSGQTWGTPTASIYPSSSQRFMLQSMPDGRTLCWASDDKSGLGLRNKGVIFVSSNQVIQSKIVINSDTNVASFLYPAGLYHDGLVDTLWANAHGVANMGYTIYFDEQPFDQSLPNLTLTQSSNSVIVSWPNTGSYTLQQNDILAASARWITSSYRISTANGTNSITITPLGKDLFFRLSKN